MAKPMPYGVREPAEIPEVADKVLNDYFYIAETLKIPSCIVYGLCLGFVRDGGYIRGDNDLDVVAFTSTGQLVPALSEALIDYGFKRGLTFDDSHDAGFSVHFHRDRILLDIYFHKHRRFYDMLGRVLYKGKEYPIPFPVEEYLEDFYGDWKVPDVMDFHVNWKIPDRGQE